jgi:hypothetical protein
LQQLKGKKYLPDGTHSSQEMDTLLEVASFLHCTIVLEIENEYAAHSLISDQAILEQLS